MRAIPFAFFFSIVSDPCFAESAGQNPFDSLLNGGLSLAFLGGIVGGGGAYFIPHAPNVPPWNLTLWESIFVLSLGGGATIAILKVFSSHLWNLL